MKNLRIDKNHENSKNKNNEKKRGRDKNGNHINTHDKFLQMFIFMVKTCSWESES